MSFDWNFFLNLICSIGGILFFINSSLIIKKIKEMFPAGAKAIKKWNLIQILIYGFLAGYVLNIIFLAIDLNDFVLVMTAIVYLFGGLFVNIVINLSHKTYKVIVSENT